MGPENAARAVYAILFAAGEPVPAQRLAQAVGISAAELREAAALLEEKLSGGDSAVALLRLGEKLQLATKPEYAEYIRLALETRKPPALSPAAMETIAIVAYRQPVTKTYVEQVRGVDCAYSLSSLVEKGFLTEGGRLEVPGRPILYVTTDKFLRVFGLSSLSELPPLPEEGQMQLPLFEADAPEPAENPGDKPEQPEPEMNPEDRGDGPEQSPEPLAAE